ncbi:sporulation membrane protein YtrI [Anoxybacteroides tepidamans]|uniref:sporulation membrane protein YtrI n=1 Tax=Anoxybacteroides tepidamans TaxID=265948 RepID=UPI0004866CEA|nr:sporulation membrane protein YtrI [Anoxybacillus tepidamans]
MRIPPYYQSRAWQRFFAGAAIGAIVSWFIFLHLFGILQEKQVRRIAELQDKIVDLQNDIQIWQEDYVKLNKMNKKKLTIQEIRIHLTNAEQYKLDSYMKFRIEESVKEDISHLVAKDIETVYKSKELLKKTIENKTFTINEQAYKLEITELFLFTTLSIELKLKPIRQ